MEFIEKVETSVRRKSVPCQEEEAKRSIVTYNIDEYCPSRPCKTMPAGTYNLRCHVLDMHEGAGKESKC